MFKRITAVFLILATLLFTAACGDETEASSSQTPDESYESKIEQTSSEPNDESSAQADDSVDESVDESKPSDTIPPAFIDATDGKLQPVTHNAGDEIDLLEGLTVRDNVTADENIVIIVSDDGGYKADTAGTYTVTIEAKDEAGNTATVTVEVTVKAVSSGKTIVLGDKMGFVLNQEDALSYTNTGTKFRNTDEIQVMSKEFFTAQYEKYCDQHTNNGKVPFLPYGVIIITDEDFNIVQTRLSVGQTIEIDSDGNMKNSGLSWNSSIDAANGGGMFKNILNDLDALISDDGFIMFVGNPGDAVCRNELVKELFFSGYTGGAITIDQCDVSLVGAKIELG